MKVIETHALGKRYRLGERGDAYLTVRDAIGSMLRSRGAKSERRELWALRDVALEVEEGEILGIIGRNGAGKSTLLKILARVTEPTLGVARMRGRVGALLEVGTGFHEELTGRENVYLSGAVLGMSRREIDSRFDEIVAFSGVERFLETPVKRYSSGMALRLAFSVAAHLEPEIVVVDEVLAVGDAEFRSRCVDKMLELRDSGRTLVLVSHDLATIARLCSRVIWLDQGVVRADGESSRIVETYLAGGVTQAQSATFESDPSKTVQLQSVRLTDGAGRVLEALTGDEPLIAEIHFTTRQRLPELDASVYIENRQGARVVDDAWSDGNDTALAANPGEHVARVAVPPVLPAGEYRLGIWMGTLTEDFVLSDVLSFRLDDSHVPPHPALARPMVDWEVVTG